MERRVRLAAVTSHPRHELVSALTAVLSDVGWILDFQKFSNIALGVQFEVPRSGLPALRRRLEGLPLRLSAESVEALLRLEASPEADLPEAVPGSLHVTFVHAEPDLRIPVPSVPG